MSEQLENGRLMPIGKYKGQPIEVLQSDPNYSKWLTSQVFFRERHPDLYTIIVNNFTEPTETPEHNLLQARFLDEDWAISWIFGKNIDVIQETDIFFEEDGYDVVIHYNVDTAKEGERPRVITRKVHIELKPLIGDDYPAILRKMKSPRWHERLLVYQKFQSASVSEDIFIKIFKNEGITARKLD